MFNLFDFNFSLDINFFLLIMHVDIRNMYYIEQHMCDYLFSLEMQDTHSKKMFKTLIRLKYLRMSIFGEFVYK